MHVRVLTQEDVHSYRELRLLSLEESTFAFGNALEQEKELTEHDWLDAIKVVGNPPEQFVLGAFDEDKLCGIVSFRRDTRIVGRHKSHLSRMYVAPNSRKLGLGIMLMTELIHRTKKMQGLEQIHLWVLHRDNERNVAAKLYERFGFISCGTVPKDIKFGDEYVSAEYKMLYL
jgi:ribosomal protein S18 acetylase RimI-like enzyme